jgi:3-dehydroquinate synthase
MKIVLTGFMGTGKTSVGRELSRRLTYPFIDTDILIEEREGMAISLIFREKGQDYFRKVERAVIREVSQQNNVIIATGGGVIKNQKNVRDLGRRGVILWLKTDPEIILKRVLLEGGKRPLLDVEEPLHEIKKLLSEREGLYQQSDITFDTSYITPGETAEEIIENLGLDSEKARVDLGERSYEILIGRKTMQKLGYRLIEFRPSQIAVVSNETIFAHYGDPVLNSLNRCGLASEVLLIPDGEEYKDLLWANHLYGELLKKRFGRDSLLIALGGGVIGDLTAFVASTYMRGIQCVQVPTTLLAQVDSSVGGKTGVNHTLGKNMIGTFYQPSLVFIDVDTLKTLPQREFSAGMAETIKYGVIADRRLFESLESNRRDILGFGNTLIDAIKRSCAIKADVVSRDERESGLRSILNFGHTFGHAIETVTGYKEFLHGEAIAIGMCVASFLAVHLKILKQEEAERIKKLIESYNLPTSIPKSIYISSLINTMGIDKKVKAGTMRFILPEMIGKVRMEEHVDSAIMKKVIVESQKES